MVATKDIADILVWAFRDEHVETALHAAEDAVTVYWAVLALPAHHGAIVKRCARLDRTPDWRAPIGPVVSLSALRRARSDYRDWVRALTVLQRTLDGTLARFRVSGPSAPEEPWRLERLAAPPRPTRPGLGRASLRAPHAIWRPTSR